MGPSNIYLDQVFDVSRGVGVGGTHGRELSVRRSGATRFSLILAALLQPAVAAAQSPKDNLRF